MQPNKAKSFPAATVWYTAAVENVVPKARKVGMLGGHTRVSKSADDGEVEACWECCAPNTPEGWRQEPGLKTPGTEREAEGICSEKATREAGGEEGRPHKTQGRQGEVSIGQAYVRHVQRSHSSGQRQ